MSSSSPSLSVVIPVYNEEAIIEGALQRYLQGLDELERDVEVIVAANGCRDQTVPIVRELMAVWPMLRLLESPTPDYGRALRAGLLAARGDIVVCDEIDLCDLGFVKRALRRLDHDECDVVIGSNVKVQNNVAIYTGTTIEDDVFLGPSCVLTNVTNPRSQVKRHSLYEHTLIRRGTTIGANATIVCGITLGRYAFIAAGAVVARDVPDYGFIVGVPGRLKGWMSRHGHLLQFNADGLATCPESNFSYRLENNTVRCLSLDEDLPLPDHLATGTTSYDSFKSLS